MCDINGYDWSVTVKCSTDGASSTFTGPFALMVEERSRWLADHDRHEFAISSRVLRPVDTDIPVPSKVVNIDTRGAV